MWRPPALRAARRFWTISVRSCPNSKGAALRYDRMLRVIASVEERGLDGEQAQIEAFYAVQKHK